MKRKGQINIDVPLALKKKIDNYKAWRGLTMNDMIIPIILEWVEAHPVPEQIEIPVKNETDIDVIFGMIVKLSSKIDRIEEKLEGK